MEPNDKSKTEIKFDRLFSSATRLAPGVLKRGKSIHNNKGLVL